MIHPRLFHQVGERALEWLAANADRFRPARDPLDPDVDVDTSLKPLGELAQISVVLDREGVAGGRQRALARGLLDLVWEELGRGGLLVALLDAEPGAPYPLELYAPLWEAGLRHPPLEDLLRQTTGTRGWAAQEVLPTRALGILNAERRTGLPPHGDRDQAVRRTWLGRLPEPWTAERTTCYMVTHTVFHLTNWGQDPAGLPDDIADYLTTWLPVWVDVWCATEDWDLLGELLAVDACLPRCALDEQVWTRYALAQRPDGLVPVRGRYPDADADPDQVFAECRHPTLVVAFAAALATSRAMTALVP
ncbi:hypothetical protein Q5530_12210 [Saccharothrix sp. BKS2]|uniref:DUF6895 family protein n=1 Tax=Saccharothrix sp. BKS2 TaxID=3064400 RepID=UPI0039E82BD0